MKKRAFISAILVALTLQVSAVPAVLTASAEGLDQSLVALQQSAELSADKVSLGSSVTVTAAVKDNCTYAMYYSLNGGKSWKTAKVYSEDNTAVIKASVVGEYDVCVKTKDANGAVTKEYLSFEVVDFSVNLQLKNSQISLGQKETITASVDDESSEYTYKFYYKKSDSNVWRVVQDFNSNDRVVVLPKQVGEYDVCVKAKNSTGNVRKSYTKFIVNDKLVVSHTLTGNIIAKGDSITVTPSSTGGTGTVKYAVYYTTKEKYEAGEIPWEIALAFGQEGEAVIAPENEGEYVIITKAMDESGCVSKTEYTHFYVGDVEPLSVTCAFSGSQEVYSDTSTKLTAQASGGVGDCTYAVMMKEQDSDQWKTMFDFSKKNEFRIYLSSFGYLRAFEEKTFDLKVVVKDNLGNTSEAYSTITAINRDEYESPLL